MTDHARVIEEQGRRARARGLSYLDNPFPTGDERWEEWFTGWRGENARRLDRLRGKDDRADAAGA